MTSSAAGLAVLALLLGHWSVVGWRLKGTLPAGGEFTEYAGKFCFDYNKAADEEAGEFHFSVSGKVLTGPRETKMQFSDGPPCYGPCETQGNLYLVVFDDEEKHWQRAQRDWNQLTCEEMLHFSSFAMPLTPLNGNMNRTVFVHEKLRPRFWYFTFAACGVTIEEQVSYELHSQNRLMGFQSEFGVDEEGILQLNLLAAGLFLAITLGLRHVARRATGAEALRSRPILRMLILSSLFSALGAACRALHYLVFSFNGYGLGFFDVLGLLWVCAAKAMLTLLQLLTAKGWSLFYGRRELTQRSLMIGALCCIILLSACCEIHADYAQDWSTTLYLYEHWTGMLILFLNVLLFGVAWRSMCEVYARESSEEVRVFYVMISASSLVYFLTLPLLCILSAAFAPWVRAKYISRGEVAARLIATAMLAYCLRPSRLDAMVNARLAEGLGTVGEMGDEDAEDAEEGAEELIRAEAPVE